MQIQKDVQKRINKRVKNQNKKNKRFEYLGYIFDNKFLFVISFPVVLYDRYKEKKYKKMKWSEDKAEKMANKYFGKIAEIEGESLLFDLDWSSSIWFRKAKRKDKKWLKKFSAQMSEYIEKKFEIQNYKKKIEYDWVIFEKE